MRWQVWPRTGGRQRRLLRYFVAYLSVIHNLLLIHIVLTWKCSSQIGLVGILPGSCPAMILGHGGLRRKCEPS